MVGVVIDDEDSVWFSFPFAAAGDPWEREQLLAGSGFIESVLQGQEECCRGVESVMGASKGYF